MLLIKCVQIAHKDKLLTNTVYQNNTFVVRACWFIEILKCVPVLFTSEFD